MAMGKLWVEAANTAEARETSFLSKNSVETEIQHWRSPESVKNKPDIDIVRWLSNSFFDSCLTFQYKLLHLDLVKLVGADDDAVTRQMDAAAGLQSLDFLCGERNKARHLHLWYNT